MPKSEPVGAIRQTSNSGSGADDGIEFIRCVGGRQPEIHEVWTFGNDGINPEVHPFACVDVGDFIGDCFATNYLAGNGGRVPMFGRKLINGSFKWMGVPDFLRADGPPWNDNILCPSMCWGVGGTAENVFWGGQHGGHYGGFDVPWRGAVPARLAYLPQSLENARATARRVRDDLLLEHHLARAQILSDSWHILRDQLVNLTDCAWDDLWDEPVLNFFLWGFSVVSVSSYLWIATWIAFWIAYDVNQFIGIA